MIFWLYHTFFLYWSAFLFKVELHLITRAYFDPLTRQGKWLIFPFYSFKSKELVSLPFQMMWTSFSHSPLAFSFLIIMAESWNFLRFTVFQSTTDIVLWHTNLTNVPWLFSIRVNIQPYKSLKAFLLSARIRCPRHVLNLFWELESDISLGSSGSY